MIMITPHGTLLLLYLHIEKGDFGDIDGAMVDLHRTVHVQINHCNIIVIFFTMQMLFFIMQMIWSIRPTQCFTRIVSIESVFSFSFVNFMLAQRKVTREIWLMWNSFTNQASNEIWFSIVVEMKILSFNIYKAMEQKPTMRATKSGLQWQLK